MQIRRWLEFLMRALSQIVSIFSSFVSLPGCTIMHTAPNTTPVARCPYEQMCKNLFQLLGLWYCYSNVSPTVQQYGHYPALCVQVSDRQRRLVSQSRSHVTMTMNNENNEMIRFSLPESCRNLSRDFFSPSNSTCFVFKALFSAWTSSIRF